MNNASIAAAAAAQCALAVLDHALIKPRKYVKGLFMRGRLCFFSELIDYKRERVTFVKRFSYSIDIIGRRRRIRK